MGIRGDGLRANFPFHTLGSTGFEDLVCQICLKILGTGTISFADGKDGGRDATFEGVAEKFPSIESPLKGRFVIQAKHTSNPAGSCSDADFGKAIDGERPKITRLIKDGELDHYLVFTNRRKPADKTIAKEKELRKMKLKSAHILGESSLRNWLVGHRQIWHDLGFDRFEQRLDIRPQDLAEVVLAFGAVVKSRALLKAQTSKFAYQPKPKKNKINGLTPGYFEFIKSDSLPYFANIEDFLKNPRNSEYRDQYEDSANEIKGKIIANKDMFPTFDSALTAVYDEVVDASPALSKKRRFVNIFLHYMYYTCDIGQNA